MPCLTFESLKVMSASVSWGLTRSTIWLRVHKLLHVSLSFIISFYSFVNQIGCSIEEWVNSFSVLFVSRGQSLLGIQWMLLKYYTTMFTTLEYACGEKKVFSFSVYHWLSAHLSYGWICHEDLVNYYDIWEYFLPSHIQNP